MLQFSIEPTEQGGHQMQMQWSSPQGKEHRAQYFGPRGNLKAQAILEHRHHVLFYLDNLLQLATAHSKELSEKQNRVLAILKDHSAQMERSQTTHFAICRRVLENARFYAAIIPASAYMEGLKTWRYIETFCNHEIANIEAKKWLYE